MDGLWKSKICFCQQRWERKKWLIVKKTVVAAKKKKTPDYSWEHFLFYGLFLAAGLLWPCRLVFLFCFCFFCTTGLDYCDKRDGCWFGRWEGRPCRAGRCMKGSFEKREWPQSEGQKIRDKESKEKNDVIFPRILWPKQQQHQVLLLPGAERLCWAAVL